MKNSFIRLCVTGLFAGVLMLTGCGGGGDGGGGVIIPAPTTPTKPTDPVPPTPTDPVPPTPTDPVPPTPTDPVPPVTPTTAAVLVSAAGSVTDGGSTVNTTYTMTAGEYVYTIAGFGSGDKLQFPATQTPTVNNSSFTDGMVDVQWSYGGQTIIVRLTGLSNAQDIALYSVSSFNSHFGADSLK